MIHAAYVLDAASQPQVRAEVSSFSFESEPLFRSVESSKMLLGPKYHLLSEIEYNTLDGNFILGFSIPESKSYAVSVLCDAKTDPHPCLKRYRTIVDSYIIENDSVSEWPGPVIRKMEKASKTLLKLFNTQRNKYENTDQYSLDNIYIIGNEGLCFFKKEYGEPFEIPSVGVKDGNDRSSTIEQIFPAIINVLDTQSKSTIPGSSLSRISIKPDTEISVDKLSDKFNLLIMYKGSRLYHSEVRSQLVQAFFPLTKIKWSGGMAPVNEVTKPVLPLIEELRDSKP